MTISIWRYSHLILAISSSIFILITALTGSVLAFEPISNKLKPYAVKNTNMLSLSKTIKTLKAEYDNIISIDIDNNDFVVASVVTNKGKKDTFYINPFTGKKITNTIERATIFKFATKLHRSLFLKSTGRIIIGIVSFLLLLIATTGVLLIIKKQGGVNRFFSKIVKEDFVPYYHTVISRYALIPIIIVTVTGIYLSLEKFSLLPSNNNKHVLNQVNSTKTPQLNSTAFAFFKSTTLDNLKRIEFPFSSDKDDYFTLKLKDKEVYVNQYTGNIVSEKEDNLIALASSFSLLLHTGEGSILWSGVLLLTSISILFFLYSGFYIALNRKNKSIKIKNKYRKDNAEYIILVGSESGSTFTFATALYKALISEKKSVFVSELNNYSCYKKAKHLVILTATYGDGEAPTNANKFKKLIDTFPQKNTLQYSVVGFGSLAYKGFCKYAIVIDALLQMHKNFIPSASLYKINNQSFNAFKSWTDLWSKSIGLNLNISLSRDKLKNTTQFKVVNRTIINTDDSFLIELKAPKKTKFFSGDLLSIYPNEDHLERLYSIGKINNNIILSIKKHKYGICSNYLSQLKIGDTLHAHIKPNNEFYLPEPAKEVIMIANGTGIAPFLGMINNKTTNKNKTYLFWGGRTRDSYKMYSTYIDNAFYNKKLSGLYLSFSQENSHKKYVQHILIENEALVTRVLKNKGAIMICGSIAMQKDVLEMLECIAITQLNAPLNKALIKTDCY